MRRPNKLTLARATPGHDRAVAAARQRAAQVMTGAAATMCGIVGGVTDRDIVPVLIEGLRAPRVSRLRLGGRRGAQRHASSAAAAHGGQGARRWSRRWLDLPIRRPERHRPHALGHARRAERAQRAPAPVARRPRHRSQRHHREPRGAARGTQGGGLPVQLRDRHRGGRASRPLSSCRSSATCSRPCAPRWPSSRVPMRWRSSASRTRTG